MNPFGKVLGKVFTQREDLPPSSPNGVLPEGEYYTVLWGIADSYGGMTTVSLERTSAFAHQDNRRVTILTFDPQLDPEERTERLRSQGFLDKRVRIRNVWHDLRIWPDKVLRRMTRKTESDMTAADELLTAPPKKRDRRGIEIDRHDEEGKLLQRDIYSASGKIVVSDRLDMNERGKRGGRRVTLFDRKGNIIAQWNSATRLYMAWMDVVLEGKQSYINVDSSFAANLFHRYRRKNVVVTNVLHSSHMKSDPEVEGELAKGKFPVLRNIGAYDATITLTQKQRADLIDLGFPAASMRRISNPTEDLAGDPEKQRDPHSGAVLARLVPAKRVDHSIRALAQAGREVPELSLDVYGEGPESETLAELIDGLDSPASIQLKGHDQKAKQVYLDASFSLVTSVFEGQGLVILESMSAGCIPIVYDVDYGPAEIITHGVDGFLVPSGDVDALAQTILKVARMSPQELTTMRRAARKRAKEFFEPNIVREWGRVLGELEFGEISRASFKAHDMSAEFRHDAGEGPEGNLELKVKLEAAEKGEPVELPDLQDLSLAWTLRGTTLYRRVPARLEGNTVIATIPAGTFADLPKGYVDFNVVFRTGRRFYQPRIAVDEAELSVQSGRRRVYSTAHGNLSLQTQTTEPKSSESAEPTEPTNSGSSAPGD